MKAVRIFLAFVLAAALLCGAYWVVYQIDVSEHTSTLEVQIGLSASNTLTAEQPALFEIAAENLGYSPVLLRQTTILSVYTADGEPLILDGNAQSPASVDLYLTARADALCPGRLLYNHSVFYTTEYTLDASQPRYSLPFMQSDSIQNVLNSEFYVCLDEAAGGAYQGCTAVMDVILEGTVAGFPEEWQTLYTESVTLGSPGPDWVHTPMAMPLPPESGGGFLWEVRDGQAFLTGLGNIQDQNIIVPGQVQLSFVNGQYREDPVHGQLYGVTVANNVFYDCDTVQSVTFEDGVRIQDNKMNHYYGGMFEGCDNLQAVFGLPDSVTDMGFAFTDCCSLVTLDRFPASVTNLNYCFQGCGALKDVPDIPAGVAGLEFTFRECVSLTAMPGLPEGITQMSGTFYGCTSLKTVSPLPGSLTSMVSSFQYCASLEEAPEIPEGVTKLVSTFWGCERLLSAPRIPDSAELLTDCFRGCTSLTGYVSIPFIEFFIGEFHPYCMTGILEDCPNVSGLQIRICDGLYSPSDIPTKYPVIFLGEHQTGTVCPGCHTANLTMELYGVEIIFENCHELDYSSISTFLETRVPEWLTAYCPRIIFTDDLFQYRTDIENVLGFAKYPEGYVYVLTSVDSDSTIIHELAHTFDHPYTSRARYSSTSQWIGLHNAEGETAASLWYDKDAYDEKDIHSQRSETFAMAMAAYFMEPDMLKQHCPGMYEYIDTLVRNNQ